MPPLCRAVDGAQEPSARLLTDALDALADAAARARLGARSGVRAAARPARAPPGPRPGRRALGGRADRSRRAGDRGHAAGRGRGRGPGGRAGSTGARRRSFRPGRCAPASGLTEPARREDPSRVDGRVRAAVHRRPQPAAARRGHLVGRRGRRLGGGRDQASGRGPAGRARRRVPAVHRAGRGAADGRPRRGHPGHRGGAAVPEADRPAAVRGGVRRAAAGLGAQVTARPQDHRQDPAHGRRRQRRGGEVRARGPGRLPVRPGGRRRGAGPGGTGGTGPAQGSPGPAARPVGGTRRPAPAGRAEVPAARPDARPWRRRTRSATGWAAWTTTCRWSPSTPTAGSATCCPARRSGGSRRSPPRPRSAASSGPTRSAAWPGCPSSAASASARCSRTTWGWVRRRRPLALLAQERVTGRGPGPTLLVCPMSLVGNWQREAARFTPDLAVHVHHGADRLAARSSPGR